MAKGYINWKLAIVLVVAMCVCVGAGLVLHNWQKNTQAAEARPLGLKAYDQENWPEAAKQLGRYLAVKGDDVDILLKYANAQRRISPLRPNNIGQAISAYTAIQRSGKATDEDIYEATRWLVEICPSAGRWTEAESRAKKYLETHDDPLLRRLLGRILAGEGKFQEAADTLRKLVEDHPQEVQAYIALGALAADRPSDFNEPSQYWYDKMVSANPDSALAHIQYGKSLLWQDGDADRMKKAKAEFAHAENLDLSEKAVRLELIRVLISTQELDKAREQIEAGIAESPREPRLWSYWAKVAIRSQSTDEMRKVADEGLKALSVQPWEFMLWATELLIRTDQFERAKDCIAQLQKVDYDGYRPRIHFLDGLLAQRQDRPREAVAAWEKAIALGYQSVSDRNWFGEAPSVRIALADVQDRLGDTAAAIAQLRAQLSETPDFVQAHLALARLLAKRRDWAEVLEQARQVQRLSADNADAIELELQARIAMHGHSQTASATEEESWRTVGDLLDRLEEKTNDSLTVKELKAQAAIAHGKFDEAVAIIDELASESPDTVKPTLLRAQVYAKQNEPNQAVTLLDSAVERFPQSADLVIALAGLLHGQGDLGRCESVLKAAIEQIKTPGDRRELGLLLAELYREQQRSDEQRQWALNLAEQFPDDLAVKQNLLAVDSIRKDAEKAQKIVDEIKAIEGQDGQKWRIEKVRVWLAARDFLSHYTEAVRLLQENLLSNPDDQASRRLLAIVYGLKGENQLAAMIWQEALDRSSADARHYAQIVAGTVNALYKVGQDDKARAILERAEQLNIQDPSFRKLKVEGLEKSQEWSAASDLLLKMIHEDPNNLWASSHLILAYERQGMSEEALKVCDALVADGGTAVAHLLRAQTHEYLKQYDRALADYDRIVSLAPQKPGSWVARAKFRLNRGQVAEGVKDVQQALELAPDSAEVEAIAARLFLASEDTQLNERGQKLLERAIQANSQNSDLKMLKAGVLMDQGTTASINAARTLLDEITRDVSSPLKAWQWLAFLEGNSQNYDKAIDVASRGLSHYPEDPVLRSLKAQAEVKGDPAAAISTLSALLEQDPNDIFTIRLLAKAYLDTERPQDALNFLRERVPTLTGSDRRRGELMLATVLYKSGAIGQASAAFEELIRSDPNDPSPVLTWAQWLETGRRYDQVVDLVEQWRSKHPDDVMIPIRVAADLIGTGEPEALQKAEDLMKKTLTAHPNNLVALQVLAGAKLQSKRPEDLAESASLNRKILQLDPNNLVAMNNLAWFLSEVQGKDQEALDLVNRGLDIAPRYADMLDTRGVIYYRMGRFDEAERDLTRCTSLYPPGAGALPGTRLHLAKALVELGRKTEAMKQLQEALDVQNKAREGHPHRTPPMSDEDEAEARQLQQQIRGGG